MMLVTAIVTLCAIGAPTVCHEHVVTSSEFSGIDMGSCVVGSQIGVSDWLANSPYAVGWRVANIKCVLGTPPRRT